MKTRRPALDINPFILTGYISTYLSLYMYKMLIAACMVKKKLVIIFHLFGTYSVHSGLLSLVWEKVEHRCGYLVIVFCKFKTEYKCPGLYIDINYRAKDIYKEKLKVTWLEASLTFFVNGRTLFVIHSNLDITNKLVRILFCSLNWIFHYIKCNMLSESSKW